jgi:hypothetical protein
VKPIAKPDTFPTENDLKQGDALSLLLFNFSLEYTSRKIQENKDRLVVNGAHQFMVCADDVNLIFIGCES